MIEPGARSQLVTTEHGTGFWDDVAQELRLARHTHISPRPICFSVPTDEEAEDYYLARAFRRESITRYYETHSDTGE